MEEFVVGDLDFAGLQRKLSEELAAGATRDEALHALQVLTRGENLSPAVVGLLRRAIDRHFSSDDTDPFPHIRPSEERATERPAEDAIDAGADSGLPAMYAEEPAEEVPLPVEEEPEPHARETEPEPGDVIGGRYELEGMIGRGGSGLVYRALDRCRDEAGLEDSRVALKLLKPELAGRQEARRRLLAEGLRGGDLRHENLVRVFDVGDEGGDCFVSLELLDGDSLRNAILRCSPDGLPTDEALRVLAGITRGVAFLHARGLIHGDLKPGNVFLTRDGCPKLLDFGSGTGHGHDREPTLDGGGLPGRTPAYASPEVLGGSWPRPSDDVFALGCLACELLSSKHPFGRVQADEAREQRLKPALPKSLSGVRRRMLARALRFDGRRRPADAEAFLVGMGLAEGTRKKPGFVAGMLTGLALGVLVVLSIIHPAGPLARVLSLTGARPVEPPPTVAQGAADDAAASAPSGPVEVPAPSVDVAGRFIPTEPDIPAATTGGPDEEVASEAVPDRPPEPPVLPSGPGRIEFTADEYRVTEGAAVVIATVARRGGTAGDVSFRWRTAAGSATPDVDYVASDWQSVEIPAGRDSVRIYVPLVDDGVAEDEESFFLELSEPDGGATLGSPARLRVRIADDES